MIKLLSRLSTFGLLAVALPAAAAERPLPLYNQSALARGFELPTLGETAVLAAGDARTELRFDLTTEYHASGDVGESVVLDGETDLLTLAFRRGLGAGLELTIDVPVMYQGGGFMDGPVENWHSAFGLPNGGREDAPRNRYLYQYQRNGELLLDNDRSGADFGDVRFGLGWQALDGLALRGEFKFASGSSKHLSGGNNGAAVWADYALPLPPDSMLSGWLSGGVSSNGDTGVLDDGLQNHWIPLAGGGVAVRPFERWAFLTQLYYHGALYDGDLDPFRSALQFALGTRYYVLPDFAVDFAFQEDPITSSSPDFSLHLGLAWRG